MVFTQVSSRKTNRSGSSGSRQASNAARLAATSGRSCSAATSGFFERDLERLQGGPQGADADVQAEGGPQALQGVAGVGRGLPPQIGFVPFVERPLLGANRPGGSFAGPLAATDDLPDPLGGDAILAAECGEREAGVGVGEDAVTEILGVRAHRGSLGGEAPL